MAKSSPARRQPAHTATPEELADGTARAEQARGDAPAPDEHGKRIHNLERLLLDQEFEQRRQAGEDAGLHQRLSEAEARIARLEALLSMSTDWRPDPDDLAAGFLWQGYRVADGPYIGKRSEGKWPVTGFPLLDLGRGVLRPKSWAQLLDCLHMVASEVAILVNDANNPDPEDRGMFGMGPASDEDKERLTKVLEASRLVEAK
jgi:hypothetical protein